MRITLKVLLPVATLVASSVAAFGQVTDLITQPVDETKLVTLYGNTRPEAISANDQGRVADGLLIDHMLLQLQRSPEQEAAVNAFIDSLHDPNSPNYHQWLNSAQIAQNFGHSQHDLNTITSWLQSHGFTVNVSYANGQVLDFTGTAGQIRTTFHTEIHNLNVNGEAHIANMSDPQIPAALAPAIAGIVSLHNFPASQNIVPKSQYTASLNGATYYLVTPPDLATIYSFNPLFTKGITGQGQTVVVVEDGDIDNVADWTSFRKVFGLSRFTTGSFSQTHPASSGKNNCTDPGVNGSSEEAAVDAEYATSSAPGAAVQLAACSDTSVTYGFLIALENIVNASATPPSVISMSYGICEEINGAATNAAFNSAYQTAVMKGVSVFVSSGDDGGDMCARFTTGESYATTGISVNGFASTQYNVAVGGTDFGDTFLGVNSTYWSATNTKADGSALSYIPEIPWDNSCANSLIYQTLGFTDPVTSCNSTTASQDGFLSTVGGSGGPSGCATGASANTGVANGTCKGTQKPSWQSAPGVPADGVRDLPDVSLFAANGVWLHFYPICYSSLVPCSEAPVNWPGAGGTSFSAPIMAGIQALIDQAHGGAQGNPNNKLYAIARAEFTSSGLTACNSTNGNTIGKTCVFHDVTLGDNDIDCRGTFNCYTNGKKYGALSTSDTALQPAFATGAGYDLATGLGSVNATNLVSAWGK